MLITLLLLSACDSGGVATHEKSALEPICTLEPQAPPQPESRSETQTDAQMETHSEPKVRLAFVGDILLGAGLDAVLSHYGADYPWLHAAPILQRADLAMGNLETAVSLGGTPVPNKQFTFRSPPERLSGAARAGIRVLSLANNHALDFGPEAMLEGMSHLRQAGIHPVGAGTDVEEAFLPVILTAGGLKVGILGFTRVIPTGDWAAANNHPGLASGYDPAPVLEAIISVRPQVDLLIVLFHWGEEVQETPRSTDIDLANRMQEHGADIIVGHHPHVLQGFDLSEGRLIAYSMGNFIFTAVSRRLNQETGILEVVAGRHGVVQATFHPFYLSAGQPRMLHGEERERILDRLDRLSHLWQTRVASSGAISSE